MLYVNSSEFVLDSCACYRFKQCADLALRLRYASTMLSIPQRKEATAQQALCSMALDCFGDISDGMIITHIPSGR
jgi:hypothetical protein